MDRHHHIASMVYVIHTRREVPLDRLLESVVPELRTVVRGEVDRMLRDGA